MTPTFPIAIFGIVSLIAGFLVLLLLPETRNQTKLPDTLEEGQNDDDGRGNGGIWKWKKRNNNEEVALNQEEKEKINQV